MHEIHFSTRSSNAGNAQKQNRQNSDVGSEKIQQQEAEERRKSSPKLHSYESESPKRESQSSNQHEIVGGDVQPKDLDPVQADDQTRHEPKSITSGGAQTKSKRGDVIDREHALTQACGDEEFLVEILGDVIAEKDRNVVQKFELQFKKTTTRHWRRQHTR
eukprot:TRINITY_DN15048_c0_g1_i1.p1 TRINITY_DN15048_c0_g1~~TRINITY_DN15048_c0_g1_i1.p1  ORF type:complete len:161 (-),score=26.92 TRINITY_DN15048_c0_g1_i1:340-822(-)